MTYIIALASGLYIMVRGLQNMDEGLRELAETERARGVSNGRGQVWVEAWEAVFYGPWEKSSFASRRDRIQRAIKQRTTEVSIEAGKTTAAP